MTSSSETRLRNRTNPGSAIVPGLRVVFWCFAYLLSTESFFVFYGQRYEGQAKCFVLGILLVCTLMYPLVLAEENP